MGGTSSVATLVLLAISAVAVLVIAQVFMRLMTRRRAGPVHQAATADQAREVDRRARQRASEMRALRDELREWEAWRRERAGG